MEGVLQKSGSRKDANLAAETAKQNGFLGEYQRGALAKELEEAVFKLKKNQTTDVIRTKQGFLILQVLEHYDEGEQPLAKVEPKSWTSSMASGWSRRFAIT